jgi:hypothetical protein
MINDIFFSSNFLQKYFILTAVSLALAYLISVLSYYIVHKKVKFFNFRFCYRNYYIMMLPFVFPPLFFGFVEGTLIYFLVFVYFGIIGVIGEIVFSILWKEYFKKPFWEYNTLTVINKFSSLLNFIPWGVGGFLFLYLTKFYIDTFGNIFYENVGKEEVTYFAVTATAVFILQVLLFKLIVKVFPLKKRFKKRKRIIIKYIYLIFPFFLIGFLAPINYFHYFSLFLLYGVVAFFAEYLFGKMSKIIIGKKLWTYKYLTIDKKHTTPLNIIPFGLAGYYFFFLFLFLRFFY